MFNFVLVLIFTQAIQKRIDKASHLMDNMSMQNGMWRHALRRAKDHIKTAPPDSLVTAALAVYHGPLDQAVRSQLLNDWLNRYKVKFSM